MIIDIVVYRIENINNQRLRNEKFAKFKRMIFNNVIIKTKNKFVFSIKKKRCFQRRFKRLTNRKFVFIKNYCDNFSKIDCEKFHSFLSKS